MPSWRHPALACALAAVLATGSARAGDDDEPAGILPLLKARCASCHGPIGRKGGLNLAGLSGLARGGENGPVVVAGRPDESPLWERVDADEMPPKTPLPPEEKAALRRWIEAGAPGLPAVDASTPVSADHAAFAPLRRPPVPPLRPSLEPLARNAIDRFLLARLDAAGLTFAPEADRATFLRRVSFDLTGLPPTPAEIDAFLADLRPDAHERLVERLLASPAYGERWGKYWLDAAGYADSNGYFNADTDRPLAYRYRDWVIRATAADVPFDRFVAEQIAGDELSGYRPGVAVTPAMADQLVATHFLRNGQDGTGESDGNPDERRADRYAVLEGAVQIVGSSLLGLTVQCARCHDHKFEPVTQRDYYSLQAVLRGAFPVEAWAKPNDRTIFAAPAEEQARWEAESNRIDAELEAARTEFAAWDRAHRERGIDRLVDPFDAPLATRWAGLTQPGRSPPNIDTPTAPGAFVRDARLRLVDAGEPSGRRLVTTATFDWTPDRPGEWIEARFKLVARRVDDGPLAERIGFYIAAHDGSKIPFDRGNLLIDGNPAGGATVHRGYPGPAPKSLGPIGGGGGAAYRPGHRYGVRVTNLGNDRFRLEHLADGEPESNALVVSADDLPDGAFGFELCCGRSFIVDDLSITTSDPTLGDAARRSLVDEREARRKTLDSTVKRLEARRTPRPGQIAWVSDLSPTPPVGFVLTRGNYGDHGPKAEPAGIAALTDADNRFVVSPPFEGSRTTGRRLALARWLTRPGSRPAALLARVTVNRVWQHHFGTGLVATPENLGYTGAPASHPELLDDLAAGFVDSGWSLKALHRRIIGSAAYRQASTPAPARGVDPTRIDADNRLLSHYPARRLDAEAVRDAMLAAAGTLDPARFGPYVPTQRTGDGEVVVDPRAPGASRRSVYLQQRRTQVASLLEVFDAPSIVTSCPKRSVSTIPLQALGLLNSGFVARLAVDLAGRLEREAGDDPDRRLDHAFRLVAGRPPDDDAERAAARAFLDAQPGRYPALPASDARRRAWVDLCQMLLASNAFLYVE